MTAFLLSARTDGFYKVVIAYNDRITAYCLSELTPILPLSSRFYPDRFRQGSSQRS